MEHERLTPQDDLQMKAELFDLWEHVHLHVAAVWAVVTIIVKLWMYFVAL